MTDIIITHCKHGLDLRVHPRCFLCKPLPEESDYSVVRPYAGPVASGSSTSTPWCATCQGWHIPGAGPCTASYS